MATMVHLPVTAVTDGRAKTLSVALTAYDGEQFLLQQLNSIAEQTRPPDRLVVSDDGSTDRTIAILHALLDREQMTSGAKSLETLNPALNTGYGRSRDQRPGNA